MESDTFDFGEAEFKDETGERRPISNDPAVDRVLGLDDQLKDLQERVKMASSLSEESETGAQIAEIQLVREELIAQLDESQLEQLRSQKELRQEGRE